MTTKSIILLIVLETALLILCGVACVMWISKDIRAKELEREVIRGKLIIKAMGKYMELMGCPIPDTDSEELKLAAKITVEEASA